MAPAAESLVILPGKFTLTGPEARQRLLVEQVQGGQDVGQATDVKFTSSNAKVVEIEGGVAIARGSGTAKITAQAGGQTAVAEVTVAGFDEPFVWNFRNHVESVFTKSGCNCSKRLRY